MSNKTIPVEISTTSTPMIFTSSDGNEIGIPVIVDPLINEIAASVVSHRITPIDLNRRGMAIQVYFTPDLVQRAVEYYQSINKHLANHVLLPGTSLSIRADNWETPQHFPVAAAIMIVKRNSNDLYLRRDGDSDLQKLDPSSVSERLISAATKVREIYKEIPATEKPEFFTTQ